jgi:hypothetical protein
MKAVAQDQEWATAGVATAYVFAVALGRMRVNGRVRVWATAGLASLGNWVWATAGVGNRGSDPPFSIFKILK